MRFPPLGCVRKEKVGQRGGRKRRIRFLEIGRIFEIFLKNYRYFQSPKPCNRATFWWPYFSCFWVDSFFSRPYRPFQNVPVDVANKYVFLHSNIQRGVASVAFSGYGPFRIFEKNVIADPNPAFLRMVRCKWPGQKSRPFSNLFRVIHE